MKINIVLGPFLGPPPQPSGAVEMRWSKMAERFVSRGHEVNLLTRRGPEENHHERINGVERLRAHSWRKTDRWLVDIPKDLLYSINCARRLPKADVTVTNTFWLPTILPIMKKTSGAIIVNVARAPKHQMFLYLGVDRLSAVSSFIASEVIRQCPRLRGKTRVILNPVDTDIFKPVQPSIDKVASNSPRILYTGRVHPEKGLNLLVKAVTILHSNGMPAELAIAGPTEVQYGGGGSGYVQSLLKHPGCEKIRLLGPIHDRVQLAKLLQACDVYVYPSQALRGEACPVAPLEAMATGHGPIVSNLPQFNDYIEDGVNGERFDHTATNAAENLAKLIHSRLLNQERNSNLGKAARETAMLHSYDRIADQYLEDWMRIKNP